MKVFNRKNFGNIDFGTHKGDPWNNLDLSYLECHTSEENKKIARQVLENKDNIDGQGIMELC